MTSFSSESQLEEKINELLYYGMSLDDLIDGYNNCLHISVINDMRKCVEKLLSAGANPLHLNAVGKSALDLAEDNGNQILYQCMCRRMIFVEDRPFFTKFLPVMYLVPFGSVLIHENYLDWSNYDRFQKNQELLQSLKQDEAFSYAKLRALSDQRMFAMTGLITLQNEIQSNLSTFDKEIEEVILSECEERKKLNLIVESLAKVKKGFDYVRETTYWWGDVKVRRPKALLEKWDTANLNVTGSLLVLTFDSFAEDDASRQDSSMLLSELTPEPFFSLKTGPVRRSIRKSHDVIKSHLAKKRNIQFNLSHLTHLEVVKFGGQHSLEKLLILRFQSTAQLPDGIVRLKVSEKLNAGMISSFDNLVRVLKVLNPSLQIRYDVDGKTIPNIEHTRKELSSIHDSSSSLNWRSNHPNRRATIDCIGANAMRKKNDDKALSQSKHQSLSGSISFHSSGLTSGESISSIESIIQKRQLSPLLGGIEEEPSVVIDDFFESRGTDIEISSKQSEFPTKDNESQCDNLQSSDFSPPILDLDRIHDVAYVEYLQAQISRFRLANKAVTTRLEELLRGREDLIVQKSYLQQMDTLLSQYLLYINDSSSFMMLLNQAVTQLSTYSTYLEQAAAYDSLKLLKSSEVSLAKNFLGEVSMDENNFMENVPSKSIGFRSAIGSPPQRYRSIYLSAMANIEIIFNFRLDSAETVERIGNVLRLKESVLTDVLSTKA